METGENCQRCGCRITLDQDCANANQRFCSRECIKDAVEAQLLPVLNNIEILLEEIKKVYERLIYMIH